MEHYAISLVGASGCNGDAYWVSEDCKIVAVADGASGAFDKVAASSICMDIFRNFPYISAGMSPIEYIEHCFKQANQELVKKSQDDGQLSFGTLTVAVIENNIITVGAVGDTLAFLLQGNVIKKVTSPRKRYTQLVELGILSEEQIHKSIYQLPNEMWSLFDNFLPMVIPEIALSQHEARKGDTLAICSDGLSDCVNLDELKEVLDKPLSLQESCNNLICIVKDRCPINKLDDITVVLARL